MKYISSSHAGKVTLCGMNSVSVKVSAEEIIKTVKANGDLETS